MELEISVVIPIYRNAKQIDELVSRLEQTLNQFRYEVIFVNDCSPDRSLELLQSHSRQKEQFHLKNLDKNVGQQRATLEGLKLAKGNRVVVLDGDLQDAPELIPDLYQLLSQGRMAAFVKRKGMYQSGGRMFTSILIKRVIQLLSGLHYKAGSYYMFDRSILKRILNVASRCSYPYMSIIVAHFGKKMSYIDAQRGKSIGGSYSFIKRIKAAMMAVYCSLYCTYSKLRGR